MSAQIDCDLLVVGSGAGGLSAAVTAAWHGLKVVVAEKEPVFGGTTAWSGGWMWAPRNPLAQRAGIVEPIEEPLEYLRNVLGNHFDESKAEAFLEAAPHMVAFFEENTAVKFEPGLKIPDTYGNVPGAGTGGRSVIAAPYDGRALGDLVHRLRTPLRETTLLGMTIQAGPDLGAFMNVTRSPRAALHVATRLSRHLIDLALHRRGMQLRNGLALVGRLLRSAADLGVDLRVSSPAVRLLRGEDGGVYGAVLAGGNGETTVRARRGVVLATGGFGHDRERRRRLFPADAGHIALAVPSATGDGLRLGEAVGGTVDDGLAAPGAWCPVSLVPFPDGTTGRFPHIIERGKPGLIAVLADGRRFCNEGNGYHDFVEAMLRAVPAGQEVASWLVCTHAFQRRYGLGITRPAPLPVGPYVRSGYLKTGRTLAGLAANAGIDPAGLQQTVTAFNHHAQRGEDPEFGRGATLYNRYGGDPRNQPNPCVAPLARGPFYAVKVVPGSFGTFAGLNTDEAARVLDAQGLPIRGLYAAGTDMASVMGGHYPAGGINIGPAMTFGYIAGRHAAAAAGPEARP